jgi:hypothetical protein
MSPFQMRTAGTNSPWRSPALMSAGFRLAVVTAIVPHRRAWLLSVGLKMSLHGLSIACASGGRASHRASAGAADSIDAGLVVGEGEAGLDTKARREKQYTNDSDLLHRSLQTTST